MYLIWLMCERREHRVVSGFTRQQQNLLGFFPGLIIYFFISSDLISVVKHSESLPWNLFWPFHSLQEIGSYFASPREGILEV